MIILCQRRFTDYVPTLIEDVDNGEGYAHVKQRMYGKSLHLLFNFAVNIEVF